MRSHWVHEVCERFQILAGIICAAPLDPERIVQSLRNLPPSSGLAEDVFLKALATQAALHVVRRWPQGLKRLPDALLEVLRLHVPSRDLPSELGASFQQLVNDDAGSKALASLAKDYLDTHYDRSVTLQDLAKALHASPSAIRRHFAESYRLTPHAYLTRIRVGRALQLLERRELKVDAIAAAVGYGSRKDLTRAIRRFTGETPRNAIGKAGPPPGIDDPHQ